MLNFIENLSENTIAIEVSGEVTKEQYESVLVPKMNELAKRQGVINYIVVLNRGWAALLRAFGGMISKWCWHISANGER